MFSNFNYCLAVLFYLFLFYLLINCLAFIWRSADFNFCFTCFSLCLCFFFFFYFNNLILASMPYFSRVIHHAAFTMIFIENYVLFFLASYSFCHLSVVLICRALLSILAPMSSILFPLRSTFLRQVLLPKALTSTVPRERRRASHRDRDCRPCRSRGSSHELIMWVCDAGGQ